ncbi:hypothetical protein RFI_33568, partial [Reticulomyxa filosa]
MNEWMKWKLFLNGPLICQVSLLWICMAHKDATYIVIVIWSFLAIFVTHDKTKSNYFWLALVIITYSILISAIKFIFYIPGLIEDKNTTLKHFGFYDFGFVIYFFVLFLKKDKIKLKQNNKSDKCGPYLFFSSVPFLVLSAWIHSQRLFKKKKKKKKKKKIFPNLPLQKTYTHIRMLNTYYEKVDELQLMNIIEQRKVSDAIKVSQTSPLNWTRLRSHRGGNALHACVEKGATELVSWIAPFVHCNARDMYGRLPLQQAIQIRNRYPNRLAFQKRYNQLIVELVRAGCRRTRYLSSWEKAYSFFTL